jgi:nucleoside-diphosphate kinase
MAGRITFSMIKPAAVQHQDIGSILNIVCANGFRIAAMKLTRMSKERAARFYIAHKDQPFYPGLVEFMTSGPVLAIVFEKENAVSDLRKLIGSTDPAKAEPGTIRKMFAQDIQRNAIHGSDSDENALREALFHFASSEIFDNEGHVLAIEDFCCGLMPQE